MSTLWLAQVTELDGNRVVIQLTTAHPDAGPLNTDLVFAMRLLAEPALDGHSDDGATPLGPLGDEVRFGEVESTAWCEANAARYIATVRHLDPLPARETGSNWRYAKGTSVRYELIATDPRWLAHLSTGQRWDSVAYS